MDWRYIAGFFDGEGNLHVTFNKIGQSYHVSVRIFSSEKRILEKIKEFCGVGNIYERKRSENQNSLFELTISNKKDCLYFLKNVYPYLIIKKEQAAFLLNNFSFLRNSNIYFDLDKFRSFITRKSVERYRKNHTIIPTKRFI